ncbi:MAG TPA: phosphotransferase, partial [Rhodothermales bacterium]|nr:phosphotransferase [Rhodothermales bacterium]
PHALEVQTAARQLGELFLQEGTCLIMGDLWPASLLVLLNGLAVIDWELSHYGQPSQDIGHFAAHIWMLYHRNQNPHFRMSVQQFWEDFIKMYLHQNAAFDLNQHQRAIQHLGAEIMARTIGAFRSASAYKSLSVHHPVQQEALRFATNCLLENNLSLQQLFSFLL